MFYFLIFNRQTYPPKNLPAYETIVTPITTQFHASDSSIFYNFPHALLHSLPSRTSFWELLKVFIQKFFKN
jgi:hypothetical protein